ncbi:hypothetical protein [Algisphaera agarilytica]|uniref:Uncharacterized protein n=1 Tax=Algisphaera agarilytica TaxID=1385975 RepID=A0A7X0H9T5_9BACT|nr:hypothetical protein [Algisphaera agarilytica]MBB6430465.1 hypothetical protein [Algisphaera agarilytica]
MSMVPPAWPEDNLNPGQTGPKPQPRGHKAGAPRASSTFTGPKPRLAGEGQLPDTGDGQLSRSHADGQPRLRLVGAGAIVKPDLTPTEGTAIAGTNDPRWVLAVRVSEQLQGSVLPPEKRDRLVKIGKMFGLTAFDANLIIAIVQDQARRGYAPAYCPTAGEPQLRMVPPPQKVKWMTPQRTLLIAGIIAGFIALELVVLSWVF